MAGESFTLRVTARNRGSGPSDSTQLIYYQSADTTVTRDDAQVAAIEIPGLDTSGSKVESIRLAAPSMPGTYYYGVCVDPVSGESDTTNNCSGGVAVTVTPLPPDLIVDTPRVGNDSLTVDQSFMLHVTVLNQGSGPSDPTRLIYYRSTDSAVTRGDTEVGAVQVSGLDASGSSSKSIGLTAPSTPGAYYYGACVEPVSGESDATNNCSEGVAVTVSPPPPDLAADTPVVDNDSPMAGQSFMLDVTVGNRGDGSSDLTTLRYYRSTDSTITPDDEEVATDRVSGLDPGESGRESSFAYAPSTPGTYYYGACVDPAAGESDTTNNCSNGVAVTVSAYRTDNLPWVRDGITEGERRAMDHIRALAQVDQSMSQRVAGSPWLSDGAAEYELHAMNDLRVLADGHPELAVQVSTVPDNTSYLVRAASGSLLSLLASDPARSRQLLSQPWFQDGLTEEEGALVAALRSATASGKALDALIESGHVRSESITLPLAGEVSLFAVSRTGPGLEDALERMIVGVPTIEGFMGTRWPNPVVIMLQELVLDLRTGSLGPDVYGWYVGDHFVVLNASPSITYHELGHYYLHGGTGPFWLYEGAADFLSSFTLRSTGHPLSIDSTYFRLQSQIADRCAPGGAYDVQSWVETMGGEADCPYALGHLFLTGIYRVLGHDVVAASLRELSEKAADRGGPVTESEIYQAFLENTPTPQQDRFRLSYSCLHGREIPGYTPASTPPAPPGEREALVALYHATNGPGWKNNENWLTDAPLAQWHGVSVDCDGSLTGLVLFNNQLSGPIPPELADLSNLTRLSLHQNQLSGPIPPQLASLSGLTALTLRLNELTGPIPPELGSLSNMAVLSLEHNQLSGPIPSELGSLSNLAVLGLENNQLSGPIPPELGSLSNLTRLTLDANELSGPILPELAGLSELKSLFLGRNQLTGPIPPELAGLSNLTHLSIGSNQLTGPIPPQLGSLSNLTVLSVQRNRLTGTIPAELAGLSRLMHLLLGSNQLTGPILPELADLSNLTLLGLERNRLTGPIPPELSSLFNLGILGLEDNRLTGSIPPELGSLSNLWSLSLRVNQLTGSIPPELANLSNLTTLLLGRNQLTGCVPQGLEAVDNNDLHSLGLEPC